MVTGVAEGEDCEGCGVHGGVFGRFEAHFGSEYKSKIFKKKIKYWKAESYADVSCIVFLVLLRIRDTEPKTDATSSLHKTPRPV